MDGFPTSTWYGSIIKRLPTLQLPYKLSDYGQANLGRAGRLMGMEIREQHQAFCEAL